MTFDDIIHRRKRKKWARTEPAEYVPDPSKSLTVALRLPANDWYKGSEVYQRIRLLRQLSYKASGRDMRGKQFKALEVSKIWNRPEIKVRPASPAWNSRRKETNNNNNNNKIIMIMMMILFETSSFHYTPLKDTLKDTNTNLTKS